jgi:hypothetical protein
MKSNVELINDEKIGNFVKFLKRVKYYKFNLINGSLKDYLDELKEINPSREVMETIIQSFIQLYGIDWLIVKISSDIYALYDKTISVGQIIALMHKVLGIRLSSTERSQLHELRKKISRYGMFIKNFGDWGKKFDSLFKILIFGLKEDDAEKLDYLFDKAKISAGKHNIGAEFYTKDIELLEKSIIRLQIWEISPDSKFDTIRLQYYRGAAAAIVFFYMNEEESFNLIKGYIKELKGKTKLKFKPRKTKDVIIDMPLAIVGLGNANESLNKEANLLVKELNGRYFDINDLNNDSFDEIIKYITSHLTLSF